MSTYRVSLGVPAVVSVLGGCTVICGLLFLGGALVGFSAQPPASASAPGKDTQASVRVASSATACVPEKAAGPVFRAAPVERAVAAPAAATGHDAPAHQTMPRNRYSVQVGAFHQSESARSMIALLRRRGYDPVVVPQRTEEGDILRSVRIADGEDWNEARSLGREFIAKEQMDAVIVLARQ